MDVQDTYLDVEGEKTGEEVGKCGEANVINTLEIPVIRIVSNKEDKDYDTQDNPLLLVWQRNDA